jgi:hypothetical protein
MEVKIENLVSVNDVSKMYDRTTQWVYDQIHNKTITPIIAASKILFDKTLLPQKVGGALLNAAKDIARGV